jgi:hypothetical protein
MVLMIPAHRLGDLIEAAAIAIRPVRPKPESAQ